MNESHLKRLEAINRFQKETQTANKINVLLLGESGSGKSYLSTTARKPVLIDSFDKGTARGLRQWIEKGEIVVDSRWEMENPFKPAVYKEWEKETEGRLKDNFYHNFGTYYLDSLTSFSDALMNAILAKDGIAGKPPRFTKDYVPQKVAINNALNQLLNLPCDVIVTAHLEVIRDEISGQFIRRLMTTGKGVVTVPLLFDEIWVMQTKETSKGIERRILLESTGRDLARSRLAACGKLEPLEEPNIERLLKKAGITTETKPLPGTWNVD